MKKSTLESLFESSEEYIPVYDEKDNEILDENLKDLGQKFFNNVKSWAKKVVRNGKFFVKKIGKNFFMMFKQGKEYGVLDTGSQKVAARWTKATKTNNHQAFFINEKVFRGKKNVKAESSFIDLLSSELLLERSPEEIQRLAAQGIEQHRDRIGDVEDPDDDDLTQMTDQGSETGKVDFDELYEILSEVAFSLKFRNSYEQDIPSLLLMGPPGAGKTSVMKKFAKDYNMNLKILEISSLYKEVIGGFPTLEKVLRTGIDPSKLEKEEINNMRSDLYQTTVKITQTDILPPSGDSGRWLLFLDEFNRDEAKMGAAMNLILTGNIGTTYKLPLKTIVVAAGNLGKDIDGVKVATIDSAVWDRFNRKVRLDYDWLGWAKYADYENAEMTDEDGNEVKMGPKVSSLDLFVRKKTQEEGTDDWIVELAQFDPDEEARLTPRTISKIDAAVKHRAIQDWKDDNIVGKHDKEYYEKNYKKKGYVSPQEYYLNTNQWRDRYLPNILTTVIGPKGGKMARDVLQSYQTSKRELTEVSPEDALLNWTTIRQKSKKVSKTTRMSFMEQAGKILDRFETKESLKSAIDAKYPDEEIMEAVDGKPFFYVAANIHNFFKDTKTGPEDIAAFITKHLSATESYQKWQELDDNKKNNMEEFRELEKKNVLVGVVKALLMVSKEFKQAWSLAGAGEDDEVENVEESLRNIFGRL